MKPTDLNLDEILEKEDASLGGLISILEEIQSKYGYLPEEALRLVADKTGRSLVDIYGVATFYRAFSLKPRGKHLVSVCLGTACHVRGAPGIAKEFERQLGVAPGETTADKEFTLETVNCLGACALGPITVIDGHYFSNVGVSKVKQILKRAKEGLDKIDVKADRSLFPVEVSCSRCNRSLMDSEQPIDDRSSIRVTLSFGDEHGALRLSSLYGSYNSESDFEVPENAVTSFFCPHCHAELTSSTRCPECSTPMVSMIVKGGGIVQVCPKKGCKGHMLDLNVIDLQE